MTRAATKESPGLFSTGPITTGPNTIEGTVITEGRPAKTTKGKTPKKRAEPEQGKPAPKSTAVAVVERLAPAPVPTPLAYDPIKMMEVVERMATNKDVDGAKLELIVKLQRQLIADQCKAQFDATLAMIQGELPVIDRRGRILFRKKDSKGERTGAIEQDTPYAFFDDIVEAATPILAKYGFSVRFVTGKTEGGLVRVTTVLSGCGHREETTFELQHDASGSKNPVQAIGSSTTYGKRMGFCALLNIVSRSDPKNPDAAMGQDDDGAASGRPVTVGDPITQDEQDQIVELAEAKACPLKTLVAHLNETRPRDHPVLASLPALPRSRFAAAIDALNLWKPKAKE